MTGDRDPRETSPEYTEPPEEVKLSARQPEANPEPGEGPDAPLSGAEV